MTKLLGFDIESTGVDPKNDRIVTLSIAVETDGKIQYTGEWLINPGVPIPEGAAAVHGITDEIASKGQPPQTALQEILDAIREHSVDAMLVAYNCTFDTTMLNAELKRHGVITEDSTEIEEILARGILDPLVIDKASDKYRRGSRKLVDVARHYGFDLLNAHTSAADVEATLFIARQQLSKLREDVTVDQLMSMQVAAKAEQAASLSEYLYRNGEENWEVNPEWPIIK